MKKTNFWFTCLGTMVVILLLSCSSESSNKSNDDDNDDGIIGKWEQVVEQNGVKAVSTYDFKKSGKLVQTFEMKNNNPYINIVGKGTCKYTYEDDKITFKFSAADFDFSSFVIEGLDEEYIDTAIEQMKESMVDVEQEFVDVEIDGDELTAKFNGQTVTLTRK